MNNEGKRKGERGKGAGWFADLILSVLCCVVLCCVVLCCVVLCCVVLCCVACLQLSIPTSTYLSHSYPSASCYLLINLL